MDDKDKDQGDKGQAVSGTAKSTLGGAVVGASGGRSRFRGVLGLSRAFDSKPPDLAAS